MTSDRYVRMMIDTSIISSHSRPQTKADILHIQTCPMSVHYSIWTKTSNPKPGLNCSREFGFLVTLLIDTKSIRDLHTMSNTDERSELDFWRILHSDYITIGSQAESEV